MSSEVFKELRAKIKPGDYEMAVMLNLKQVGYWWSEYYPDLPQPKPETLDPKDKKALLAYLRGGEVLMRYMGQAHCRLFGQHNCASKHLDGTADMTDRTWIWPEALPHYLEVHNVGLPNLFVDHALGTKVMPKTMQRNRKQS